MAIQYSLEMETNISPAEAIAVVLPGLPVTREGSNSQFWTVSLPLVSVMARQVDGQHQRVRPVLESLGIDAGLNFLFRLDKSALVEARQSMIEIVGRCLHAWPNDAVLVFNGEQVVLLRRAGRITLHRGVYDWQDDSKRTLIGPGPFDFADIPDIGSDAYLAPPKPEGSVTGVTMPTTVEYVAGSEFAPYPVGQTLLCIGSDGKAELEHRKQGARERWEGCVRPETWAEFLEALSKSSFPEAQLWPPPPPGETIRRLTVSGDKSGTVMVPWHAAMKAPGYDVAFRILDEIIGQLSGGVVRVVKDSTMVHVRDARRVAAK